MATGLELVSQYLDVVWWYNQAPKLFDFILFFLLFYSIIIQVIERMPLFKEHTMFGKPHANRMGRVTAGTIAAMMAIGLQRYVGLDLAVLFNTGLFPIFISAGVGYLGYQALTHGTAWGKDNIIWAALLSFFLALILYAFLSTARTSANALPQMMGALITLVALGFIIFMGGQSWRQRHSAQGGGAPPLIPPGAAPAVPIPGAPAPQMPQLTPQQVVQNPNVVGAIANQAHQAAQRVRAAPPMNRAVP